MDPKFDEHFVKYRSLYEQAIKDYVCAHCIDFGEDGFCHLKDPTSCSINKNLKAVVQIASAIHKNKLDPYIQSLREEVCSHCENSRKDGSCPVRDEVECCLNRYLPLVVDAVEAIQKKLKKSKLA